MTDETIDVRARIVSAAAKLLADGGREAVSTRAVSAAASVQAPTIYRQFGDMKGLLDAVAGEALSAYVRQKKVFELSDDALGDLRRGWTHHVAFGLANPSAYLLIYSDPSMLADSPAKREGDAMLHELIARVAQAGRLGVSVPHAARMISSGCRGVTLSLIATPEDQRDPKLSDAMRDAVFAAITVGPSNLEESSEASNRLPARAVALRAVLSDAPDVLSPAELHLMREWLDRLSTKG